MGFFFCLFPVSLCDDNLFSIIQDERGEVEILGEGDKYVTAIFQS